jgi:hypothetical protein
MNSVYKNVDIFRVSLSRFMSQNSQYFSMNIFKIITLIQKRLYLSPWHLIPAL